VERFFLSSKKKKKEADESRKLASLGLVPSGTVAGNRTIEGLPNMP
jgi:hypothetical protein